jgi:DNA (cytosine-5)-methyltransferase 1
MIKVGSDFSGVGAFNQALRRLGVDYKEVFACDMDKYARQTFIHNYGEPDYFPTNVYDREIPTEPLDIYMTSPPCQAFSLAGKRKGKEDMRGILFFNSLEFIRINKPRYFIFENVKGLLSDDNGKTFSEWVNLLGGKSVNGDAIMFPYEDSVPYHLYWQVLNAKLHGVPQNRERVFLIGVRDDKDNTFRFPAEEHLTKRLKDVLDDEVDDKYYLSSKMVDWIGSHRDKRDSSNKFPSDENDIGSCINARYFKMGAEDQYIKVGTWRTHEDDPLILDDYNSKINDTGIIGTITGNIGSKAERNGHKVILPNAVQDGSGQPVIRVQSATSKGYEEAEEGDSINLSVPNSKTRRGRVGKGVAQTLDPACNQSVVIGAFRGRNPDNPSDRTTGAPTQQQLEINDSGTSNAITTVQKDNVVIQLNPSKESGGQQPYQQNRVYDPNGVSPALNAGQEAWGGNAIVETHRIRRLTPRECFRLMDFPDSLIENINYGNLLISQGIYLSLYNKTDLICNAKVKDVKENLKQRECVSCIIKDTKNMEMKISSLSIHTDEIECAKLKAVVQMSLVSKCVQSIITQIESGETLYLAKKDSLKLQKEQDKRLLIQVEKCDLEERENLYIDYCLKFTLEENLKGMSASITLTMIQTIMNYLIYTYSIPKENTICVILNYKNYQKNFLKGELSNLKMGSILLSDSQAYKQAGNSIVVNVLYKIIKNLNL